MSASNPRPSIASSTLARRCWYSSISNASRGASTGPASGKVGILREEVARVRDLQILDLVRDRPQIRHANGPDAGWGVIHHRGGLLEHLLAFRLVDDLVRTEDQFVPLRVGVVFADRTCRCEPDQVLAGIADRGPGGGEGGAELRVRFLVRVHA